jgi:negative regulator of flagellin synthesis FlgM
MKIGPSGTDGLRIDGKTVGPERAPAVRTESASGPVAGPPGVERISLSSGAPALPGQPLASPFDDRKVEELRRAIAEGRFPFDARRVANELISEARELLGLGRQDAR